MILSVLHVERVILDSRETQTFFELFDALRIFHHVFRGFAGCGKTAKDSIGLMYFRQLLAFPSKAGYEFRNGVSQPE